MEGDRKSYAEEVQAVVRKQKAQIEKLKRERGQGLPHVQGAGHGRRRVEAVFGGGAGAAGRPRAVGQGQPHRLRGGRGQPDRRQGRQAEAGGARGQEENGPLPDGLRPCAPASGWAPGRSRGTGPSPRAASWWLAGSGRAGGGGGGGGGCRLPSPIWPHTV